MSVYRVVELEDGSLGKVKVSKTPQGWTAKDYIKFGAAAILPIAAAGLVLADRVMEREMRSAKLGDEMFGGRISGNAMVTKPIKSPSEKQKYMAESDTELAGVPVNWEDSQVGGSLDDLIKWGKSNKKKLAAAGITLAALAALKAMTNPENYDSYSAPNVVDVYGESMVQPDFSSLYGSGLYAEAQRRQTGSGATPQPMNVLNYMNERNREDARSAYSSRGPPQQTGAGILSWAKNNPKAAIALGLGGLLGFAVPVGAEVAGAVMQDRMSQPGYLWK